MVQAAQTVAEDEPRKRHPNVESDQKDQVKVNEGKKMFLPTRLLLSAELFGTETAMAFEQLYTVPNLQTLGMPLSLVSLTSLIAGPTAVLLVPLLGWYGDTGSNPTRRKNWALVFSSGVLVCGLCLVMVVNLLQLRYVTPSGFDSNQTFTAIVTSETPSTENYASRTTSPTSYGNISNVSFKPPALSHSSRLASVTVSSSGSHLEDDVAEGVPVMAGIGMLGYVLTDVGYDCVISVVKTWMVTCSPPADSTPTLVGGLMMTSMGGMLSSALGMVNLASVVGLWSESQSGLAVQTSIQAAVVVIAVLMGMTSSLVVGNKQLRSTSFKKLRCSTPRCEQEVRPNVLAKDDTEDVQNDALFVRNTVDKVSPSEETQTVSLNLVYNGHDAGPENYTSPLFKTTSQDSPAMSLSEYNTIYDKTPASEGEQSTASSHSHGVSQDHSERQRLLPDKSKTKAACCPFGTDRHSLKLTITIICCSLYFSVGVICVYMLMISDYVGKEIYGGDPEAPLGSDGLARYQEGVRMASYGSLVYYALYLLLSLFQQRIVKFTGYKFEYVTVQLALSVCLIVLALTARLETFFLLCGVAGVQRAVSHLVPFAVVSDAVRAEDERSGGAGHSKLGLAMAVLTATIPLAYATLFPWAGPLEAMTGVVAVPLWLGAGFALISAALFLLLHIES